MDQQKPNIEAIMGGIREQVRKELAASGRDRHTKSTRPIEPERDPESALIDYDELNYLNAHYHDWAQMVEVSSHRRFFGRIIVWFKRKVVHTVLDHVLSGYFERERAFQVHLVRYLNANARYIDNRDYRNFWQVIEKIDREIVALNERHDRLFDEAYASVMALRQELDEARRERQAA